MPKMVKTATEQIEESIQAVLTEQEKKKIVLQIGSALLAAGIWLAGKVYQWVFPDYESISALIMLLGAIVAAVPIFIKGIQGLASKNLDNIMDQLVSLALLAAIAKGDFQTAILIPIILSIAHFLEERSILGAKSAIDSLKTMQAREACLLVGDTETTVKSEDLNVGDIIRVRPGEMIPIDGSIIEGTSSVDQSSMTGETLPKDVSEGDTIFAGTINIQGFLKVRVSKKADETSLSKIVELMKEAEQSKTETMRIIEEYTKYYLPLVIIIAAVTLFLTQDMNRVIAVFVVSCPCAQVLVSTTAMVASLSVSSRNGILIKNSAFLETLGDVKTIVFDKTGTLTSGKLDVSEIHSFDESLSDEKLLSIAAMAGWASKHPVSKAVALAAKARELEFEKDHDVEEQAGMGVIASTSMGKVILGKRDLLEANKCALPEEPNVIGSLVWVALSGKVLGYIVLSDTLREDAIESVEMLRTIGVEREILVTGDRSAVANVIKEALKLDDVYAECLPSDKLDIVEEEMKKGNKLMVVGDGINDALALVKADVGIAMGSMESDIAIKSADIALMGTSLDKLPFIIKLARMTKSIIYQNMGISAISSVVMIGLAIVGVITPLTGSLLHNIGALFVLANSARILKFDRDPSAKKESAFLDYLAEIDPFADEANNKQY